MSVGLVNLHRTVQFSSESSVQSLSPIWLVATPWTAAHQASLCHHLLELCSRSCPLSQWCHPIISSSVDPFSSCLQSFPASGSSSRSQFFTSGGQSIGASALASVLPMNIQGWSPLGGTLKSSAPQFQSISSPVLNLLYGPTLTSVYDYWKNHSLATWTKWCLCFLICCLSLS